MGNICRSLLPFSCIRPQSTEPPVLFQSTDERFGWIPNLPCHITITALALPRTTNHFFVQIFNATTEQSHFYLNFDIEQLVAFCGQADWQMDPVVLISDPTGQQQVQPQSRPFSCSICRLFVLQIEISMESFDQIHVWMEPLLCQHLSQLTESAANFGRRYYFDYRLPNTSNWFSSDTLVVDGKAEMVNVKVKFFLD